MLKQKASNLSETDELYDVLSYVMDPSQRFGENLNPDGYNMFYDSLNLLENNGILSYCIGNLYTQFFFFICSNIRN